MDKSIPILRVYASLVYFFVFLILFHRNSEKANSVDHDQAGHHFINVILQIGNCIKLIK